MHVFVSGQGPLDPATNELNRGSFAEQAELVFRNVGALLEAAGATWGDVVKVNAYLGDIAHFSEFNEIYGQYFTAPYPARTTIQASLPFGIALEVDCVAVLPGEPGRGEAA
jgi:2-iminobutanoate/2-iminopropanoate deaminase